MKAVIDVGEWYTRKILSESPFLASTIDVARIIITDIQLGYLG